MLIPPEAHPSGREHRILFVGRQEPRKGLPVLLVAGADDARWRGAWVRYLAGQFAAAERAFAAVWATPACFSIRSKRAT